MKKGWFAQVIGAVTTVAALVATPGSAGAVSFMGLGDVPGGSFFSVADGVSAGGSAVVGWSRSFDSGTCNGCEAFRWTSAGGMAGLGDLPGGAFDSFASGVSADGSVVVGRGTSADTSSVGWEAFRWTSGGGMVGMGDLPGGVVLSVAGWWPWATCRAGCSPARRTAFPAMAR